MLDELFELFGELFELFELFGELFELFGELFELFWELLLVFCGDFCKDMRAFVGGYAGIWRGCAGPEALQRGLKKALKSP